LKYLLPSVHYFHGHRFIFLGWQPHGGRGHGTLGSFILALAYRGLTWGIMRKSVLGTVKVTTMIFMIIIVSTTYGQILAFTGAASGMTQFITHLSVPPILIIIGMLVVVLILGCFMETVAIMMITLPIYMPVVNALGFNTVWFGVLMLIALETGLITPPFGVTLFVMKGVLLRELRWRISGGRSLPMWSSMSCVLSLCWPCPFWPRLSQYDGNEIT